MLHIIFIVSIIILILTLSVSHQNMTILDNQKGGNISQSEFVNFCRTDKPRGSPNPICNWWKHRQSSNKIKKPTNYKLFGSISHNDPLYTHQLSDDWSFIPYDPLYYFDSATFCQNNPNHRLCPNHWI